MSAIDIPATIMAVTGLLTPVGGGIGWVIAQIKAIQKELDKCEEGRAADRVVIELLWQVVSASDPDSPILKRAKVLLDRANAEAAK